MLRKSTALAVILGAVLTVHASSAAGQPVDYAGCSLGVDPFVLQAGDQVEMVGSGYHPGLQVDIVLDHLLPAEATIGSVTPDSDGDLSVTVAIPADLSTDQHSLSVACSSEPAAGVGRTLFTVEPVGGTLAGSGSPSIDTDRRAATAPAAGGGGSMPRTGSDAGPIALVAGAALMIGAAFVVAARRRRAIAAT